MSALLYTADRADKILVELCAGRSLRSICTGADMPAESTVRAWAVADHDGFGAKLERARVIGCHAIADEIIEIADQAKDSDSAAAARVKCENRRWLLSKLLPTTYGDRLELNHNISVSVANELTEARRRVALLRAAPVVIEGTAQPVRDEGEARA